MQKLMVHFRGVSLLKVNKAVVTAVLFPRALLDERVPAGYPPGEWKLDTTAPAKSVHPDGTRAREHFPQLVPFATATKDDVIRLTDCSVVVGLKEGDTEFDEHCRDHMFAIRELSSHPNPDLQLYDPAPEPNPAVVTAITFRGGKVTIGEISKHNWELVASDSSDTTHASYAAKRKLSIGFTWWIEADSTQISVKNSKGEEVGPFTLNSTCPEVWIANSDVLDALPEVLDQSEAEQVKLGIVDIDFRWLYRLLDPRNNPGVRTWDEWRKLYTLPAPRLVEVSPKQESSGTTPDLEAKTYNVSTCFPAIWDE